MVSEYVQARYPDAERVLLQVRLGSPPAELQAQTLSADESAALRVWSRWADAVVELEDRVVLVEAKIRPKMGPLEALLLYEVLLPNTPDLELRGRRVEKRFVYAVEDPVLNLIARQLGILPELYVPAWLRQYLAILPPRERRAPTSGLKELQDVIR